MTRQRNHRYLEVQLAPVLERARSRVIHDQEFIGGKPLEAEQLLLVANFHQFVDQNEGGGEAHQVENAA